MAQISEIRAKHQSIASPSSSVTSWCSWKDEQIAAVSRRLHHLILHPVALTAITDTPGPFGCGNGTFTGISCATHLFDNPSKMRQPLPGQRCPIWALINGMAGQCGMSGGLSHRTPDSRLHLDCGPNHSNSASTSPPACSGHAMWPDSQSKGPIRLGPFLLEALGPAVLRPVRRWEPPQILALALEPSYCIIW